MKSPNQFCARHWRVSLGIAAFLLASRLATAEEMFEGRIHGIAENQLMFTVADDEMTFVSSAATKVTLDGEPSALSELKPGDRAQITGETGEDGMHLAIRIDATREPSATGKGP
jgi:hypothetical protein